MSEITLQERIDRLIHSGQSGIWLRTHEQNEALITLSKLTKEYSPYWDIQIWDCVKGVQAAGKEASPAPQQQPNNPHAIGPTPAATEPAMAAVMSLLEIGEERKSRVFEKSVRDNDNQHLVLVLCNGHEEYITNGAKQKALVMATQHLLEVGKSHACHLIVLGCPGLPMPPELQGMFRVVNHALPNFGERREIITELLDGDEAYETPNETALSNLVNAVGGLTRGQVEAICAEALMDSLSAIDPDTGEKARIDEHFVFEQKADILDEGGLVDLDRNWRGRFDSYEYEDSDGDTIYVPGLVGMNGMKNYCLGLLDKSRPRRKGKKPPRGVLVLGIPGTGKSAFAKSLGNETQRARLSLDIGKLKGGIVGQSEELTRTAFEIIDAMAPCVLFIDELEKAFAGVNQENDSGVSKGQFGSFLKWMNDHESDVFVVATANDVSSLPPELLRAGRFNAKFFLGMPTDEQRAAIWDVHIAANELDPDQDRPNDDNWTGAEIEQCCSDADDLGLSLVEASKYIVPTWNTSHEKMQGLIEWANRRVICAESGTIFDRNQKVSTKPKSGSRPGQRARRKVTKKKSST